MSESDVAAPGGDAVAAAPVVTATPAESRPMNASEAGRALSEWRKQKSQAPAVESAPAPAVEQHSPSQEVDAAPPQEAPGEVETQAIEPADDLPPIEPPRSWTTEEKERFQTLPRELQAYLTEREQERDRDLRRRQNEAAEARKAVEAQQAEAAKAREQYEVALPQLLQLVQQQGGEFSDIKSFGDVERLAAEDPVKYIRWQAHQQKVQAVQQEMQAAQQRQAQEMSDKWATFAQEQDKLIAEQVPELADPDRAPKLREQAVNVLRDLGFNDDELNRLYNGQQGVSLRDARVQRLILDGVKYREAKAKAAQPAPKPLPPVQRPGVAPDKGAHKIALVQDAANRLNNSKGQNAIRAAADLLKAQRQAAGRRP
jgi:hypothetical protein